MSSIEDIVVKLDQFMTKVNDLEIEKLVNSAAGAMEGIEKLVESEDLTGTLKSGKDLLEAVQPVMRDLEKLIADVDTELVETGTGVADILKQAETTFANLNKLIAADSPVQTDIRAMLKEIAGMARSLRCLTDYLERHPEALIRGKPGGN
jgi:paraquat-inducible protein B